MHLADGRSEQEQQTLLREARARFNRAISLEKGFRLALTHLGTAFCHWHLGDHTNARRSLEDLLKVQPPPVPRAAKAIEGAVKSPWYVRVKRVLFPFETFEHTWGDELLLVLTAKWLKSDVLQEQIVLCELQRSTEDWLKDS